MATQLTADTNFVSQGDYRLAAYPLSTTASFVGSYAYLSDTGLLTPVSATTTTSSLVIGQVVAQGTAILANENKAVVRYNGVFEANFGTAAAGFVAGTTVYLSTDNTISTGSSGANFPKAGIYLGLSQNGNALVKHDI